MATRLEEAWQNLKLTAGEEQVITTEEDDDTTSGELISLYLLGRLHTSNSFNLRAMKSVLRNVWKPSKGLVMRDLDSNLFIFQFFFAADRDFVLNEGPWAFDGYILLLKQITRLEVPSEVEFRSGHFWVKAYDILEKKQTTSFAQVLASNISEFASCDETTMFGVDKALCFRVDIDISKPLRRGIYIKASEGHDNLQYGIWLRASPRKSQSCNAKTKLLEKKKLFMAFKKKPVSSQVRMKLTFKELAPTNEQEQISPLACENAAQMMIDMDHVIDPGPEVQKKGGSPKCQASIDNIRTFFIDNGLYDLEFTGDEFTWCNYQENGMVVEERLDRFCANTEWSLLIPNASASHVDFDMSNHLPILLRCSPRNNEKKDREKRFMFENMWFIDLTCKEVVTNARNSASSLNAMENLLSRIHKCSA
ncbi:hypothetical protein Cgig2_016069 [Carnegiea gigantea]|uniref:DUF4283 domain-containing protein n=1 Tax=Carnegiea gigantea TaxID=171969 RepID=A0A9Q1GTG7_9CARY|nr:hypothetical protein Cgig2_016069 [Carnegiea gigantea]